MKKITKYFTNSKAVERFQNRLYSQYNHVRLVRSPTFGEDGMYTWEVS